MDLSRRSHLQEIIDRPDSLTARESDETYRTLRQVNRWLGGYRACLDPACRRLETLSLGGANTLRVLDLGCGDADISVRLLSWANRRGIPLQLTGLDFNWQACRRAVESHLSPIRIIQGNCLRLPFASDSFDIVLYSTFLHHFEDAQAVEVLCEGRRVGRSWVIINDLQRHRLAYWGIRLLTTVLWRSRTVRHDGPLSVLKGFRRSELLRLLTQAGFRKPQIRRRWAFRWSAEAESAEST